MSVTRTAYDVAFAKLVSFVAYRESRRSENLRIIHDLCHWLARVVFPKFGSSIVGSLVGVWERSSTASNK